MIFLANDQIKIDFLLKKQLSIYKFANYSYICGLKEYFFIKLF